jgi:hypothetical protein
LAPAAIAISFLLLASPGCSDDDVVDSENQPPVILSLVAEPDTIYVNQVTTITVSAEDPDGDELEYLWDPDQTWLTPLSGEGNRIQLSCCCIEEEKVATIISIVRDGRGGEASDSVRIWGFPPSR